MQTEPRMVREVPGKATPVANRPTAVDMLLLCKRGDFFPSKLYG